MPRGEHPNSRANLKRPSTKEARERGSKGGKRTAEINQALKTFRELDAEVTTNEERIDMLNNLKKRAKYNNKAFEIYRDTVGLKPDERLEIEKEKLEILKEQIHGTGSDAVGDWISAVADGETIAGDGNDEQRE